MWLPFSPTFLRDGVRSTARWSLRNQIGEQGECLGGLRVDVDAPVVVQILRLEGGFRSSRIAPIDLAPRLVVPVAAAISAIILVEIAK